MSNSTGEDLASAAWFKFEEHCKKVGIIASAYTAFKCGYSAGEFDAMSNSVEEEEDESSWRNRNL